MSSLQTQLGRCFMADASNSLANPLYFCAASMFQLAVACAEAAAHAFPPKYAKFLQHVARHGISFLLRGSTASVLSARGLPPSAQQGAPNSRLGCSYSDIAAMHRKPPLQHNVCGPVVTQQVTFLPVRNALWNKPVTFHASAHTQRRAESYSDVEPRFETVLTRSDRRNPHFSGIDGAKLPPYKWQTPPAPAAASRAQSARIADRSVGRSQAPAHFAALNQQLSSREARLPQSARAAGVAALQRKPWRSMLRNPDDGSMAVLVNEQMRGADKAAAPVGGQRTTSAFAQKATASKPRAMAWRHAGVQKRSVEVVAA